MNCSIAIQYLPMDATSDEEGDYDTCMEVLKNCQLVGAKAGCGHVMTYAKINYRPAGDVMTTEHKVGKYHADDPTLGSNASTEA